MPCECKEFSEATNLRVCGDGNHGTSLPFVGGVLLRVEWSNEQSHSTASVREGKKYGVRSLVS